MQRKQNLLDNLKDNPNILEKAPDNDFAVFVWDREDCLQEAYKQLWDKEVHEEVQNNSSFSSIP